MALPLELLACAVAAGVKNTRELRNASERVSNGLEEEDRGGLDAGKLDAGKLDAGELDAGERNSGERNSRVIEFSHLHVLGGFRTRGFLSAGTPKKQ